MGWEEKRKRRKRREEKVKEGKARTGKRMKKRLKIKNGIKK